MWSSSDPNTRWEHPSSSKHEPGNSAPCYVHWLGFSVCRGALGWSFCVLLLHLEGVSLSEKSTLVTPKSLSWQIIDPLLAGRRMRVRTQLVWVSNSVLRKHFQAVTELPDLLMDV